jgi:hypothetical protein
MTAPDSAIFIAIDRKSESPALTGQMQTRLDPAFEQPEENRISGQRQFILLQSRRGAQRT